MNYNPSNKKYGSLVILNTRYKWLIK
jgi:hypothetical protein